MARQTLKIVLNSCVPAPFRHSIAGHQVFTSHYLGFGDLQDKELLDRLEGKYDALVTCDRGIPWQQNFAGRNIAIVVLKTRTNKMQDLLGLVPKLLAVLDRVKPGEVLEVTD